VGKGEYDNRRYDTPEKRGQDRGRPSVRQYHHAMQALIFMFHSLGPKQSTHQDAFIEYEKNGRASVRKILWLFSIRMHATGRDLIMQRPIAAG
jgi:hypothetical protein